MPVAMALSQWRLAQRLQLGSSIFTRSAAFKYSFKISMCFVERHRTMEETLISSVCERPQAGIGFCSTKVESGQRSAKWQLLPAAVLDPGTTKRGSRPAKGA